MTVTFLNKILYYINISNWMTSWKVKNLNPSCNPTIAHTMKWDWGWDGQNYSNYHNILSTHASSLVPVFCRYLEKEPFESILLHCNFLNFYAQLLLIRALCQFIDRRHLEARKFPTVNWLNLLNFIQHNLATCKSQKNHFLVHFPHHW